MHEIHTFKSETITSLSFPVTKDSLSFLLDTYLENEGFQFHSVSDSGNVYYKSILCIGENQFVDKSDGQYRQYIPINYIVTISFKAQNKGVYPVFKGFLSDLNYGNKNQQLAATNAGGTQRLAINRSGKTCSDGCGESFSFSENTIRKSLYVHFNGNNIKFPSELNTKVKNYNKQQTKEKRN